METLVRHPEQAQDAENPVNGADGAMPPAGPALDGNGGGDAAPGVPVALCEACGAPLAEGQDWCLQCGTARPGRLGKRPGLRAASAVSGLTLLLVAGAVAASYAALTDDANNEAGKPAGPSGTPVASVPPTLSTPGLTAPGLTTPPAVAPAPGASTNVSPGTVSPPTSSSQNPTTTGKLPSLPGIPQGSTIIPSTGTAGATPSTGTGATGNGTTSSGSTGTSRTGSTGTGSTGTGTTTTGTGTGSTSTGGTSSAGALTPITLAAGAASLYDPYGRATAKGDPSDAISPTAKQAWFVTTPADQRPMQVGLVVDLGSAQRIKALQFETDTPGFRVETYATDSSERPADILDSRWTHISSRSQVDENTKGSNKTGDGKERIDISNAKSFRLVVLWLTTRPDAGQTVRIKDLQLLH